MMLQPGVICPAVCFYDAGGYTLTKKSSSCVTINETLS